jgi:importin subunit beta-1
MDASALLAATLSPNQQERQHATTQLTQYLDSNPAQYLTTLSHALGDSQTPSHIRNAAGLAIKNALSARETQRQDDYATRWKQLEQGTRDKLKQDALATLAAPDKGARNVSGQVIAAIAAIELPLGSWNTLISQLLEFGGRADNSGLRQATLQAIGYICESIVSLFNRRLSAHKHSI